MVCVCVCVCTVPVIGCCTQDGDGDEVVTCLARIRHRLRCEQDRVDSEIRRHLKCDTVRQQAMHASYQ